MGGPASPRLSKATFLPPPSLCPPPLTQAAGGPPLLRVMSAPPRPPQEHCGQIWRTQQCLGAGTDWWGWGGGPWLGLLAAGEGEGSPGGAAARTSQGEKRDHRPFHWLTGYMQDPLSRHTPGGPQVTPHPTAMPRSTMCAGYAAVWVPRLTPSENICTAPPERGTPGALAGGQWRLAGG